MTASPRLLSRLPSVRVPVVLLVLLVLGGLPARVAAHRFALVVGANDGGTGLESLRFAERDAGKVAALLTELGGFPRENVVTLTRPDSQSLDAAFRDIASRLRVGSAAGNDLFLFFYSGHADGRSLRLGKGGYALAKVDAELKAFPAKIRVGVFDACRSGVLARYKGGRVSKPFFLEAQKHISGQVIIASSAENELSQESDLLQGSVFTHHWMNALRGSGDLDGNRRITVNEAYQYAYGKTIETTLRTRAGAQHPTYSFRISGEGDIALTDLSRGRTGLLFPGPAAGKFLVLDRLQVAILADFYKEKGKEWLVSLPPGSYAVVKPERKGWLAAQVEVPADAIAAFDPGSLRAEPYLVNQIKGSLKGRYRVREEPFMDGSNRDGTSKLGFGIKLGEAGFPALVLSYNFNRKYHVQAGLGDYEGPRAGWNAFLAFLRRGELNLDSGPDTDDYHPLTTYTSSVFLLGRRYFGPVHLTSGLSWRRMEFLGWRGWGPDPLQASSGTYRDEGLEELGIPVLGGFEFGGQNRFYGGASLGYLFIVTGRERITLMNGPMTRRSHGPASEPIFEISLGYFFL